MMKSIPFIQAIFQNSRKMSEKIAKELELDAEEVEYLKK